MGVSSHSRASCGKGNVVARDEKRELRKVDVQFVSLHVVEAACLKGVTYATSCFGIVLSSSDTVRSGSAWCCNVSADD